MDTPVLSSTLLLTLLLVVGLFFFIRASTKDRIEIIRLQAPTPQDSTLQQIQQYFVERAYQVTAVNEEHGQVTFEGFVRPSLALALFLTGLAGVGGLCLALVVSILFPKVSGLLIGLSVLIAPLAGVFYWRGSARPETVLLTVESIANPTQQHPGSLITVKAHRDELAELQRNLSLASADERVPSDVASG